MIEFLKNIKDRLTIKKRYKRDDNKLVFVEDNLIKNIIKVFFIVVVIFCIILGIMQKRNNIQAERTQKHIEELAALQDSIANNKFMEKEMSLLTEIGRMSITEDCEPCTKENICAYIDYLAEEGIIWYPEIIKKNCKIESDFGSSNVAKKYNNLFGMDHPNIRKTLSTQHSGRFATFKNWKCSVLDRVLWDYSTFRGKIPTKKQYIDKMGTKYNTVNKNYKKALK